MATINIKLLGKGIMLVNVSDYVTERSVDLLYTSPLTVDPSKWDSKKQSLKGTTTINKTNLDKR
jgi:hypothetical protein